MAKKIAYIVNLNNGYMAIVMAKSEESATEWAED